MGFSEAHNDSLLCPTWNGYIASTMEALTLVEAYLQNRLGGITRRPDAMERQDLIRSGSVLIIDQHNSSIKRWTDGRQWGPSRILGNFLVYRELERPWKAPRRLDNASWTRLYGRPDLRNVSGRSTSATRDRLRSLRGTVLASYPFKNDGLVKKSMTVSYSGQKYHVISYYSVEDALLGRLRTVSQDIMFIGLVPRLELLLPIRLPAAEDIVPNSYPSSGRSSPINGQLDAEIAGIPSFDPLYDLYDSQYRVYEMHNLVRAGSEPSVSAPMPIASTQDTLLPDQWLSNPVPEAPITSNPILGTEYLQNESLQPDAVWQNLGMEMEQPPPCEYLQDISAHAQILAPYPEFPISQTYPGNSL